MCSDCGVEGVFSVFNGVCGCVVVCVVCEWMDVGGVWICQPL